MSSNKISAIVFDLGNVLLPFDYTVAIKKLNQIEPNLGTRFIEFYNSNYQLHRDFEKGIVSETSFLNTMLDAVDNKINAQTFCNIYSDIFTINENVSELLPVLKKDYRLFLLSNTNSIHQEYGWKKYEFLKYFDKLILSHEIKSLKPEEKIYREVERASGLPSPKHFYIDDIQEYVDAAEKIGWDAVQFVDYKKLITELELRNIII
jgi:putative hydrolase of the HAD superfamily